MSPSEVSYIEDSSIDQNRAWNHLRKVTRGGSREVGGSWGSRPPPPFWGTPKLREREKNVVHVLVKIPCFST